MKYLAIVILFMMSIYATRAPAVVQFSSAEAEWTQHGPPPPPCPWCGR